MGSLLSAGGKSQSGSTFAGGPLRSIDKNLVSIGGTRGLNNELLSQLTEALRTGGIGAQIPIIQQSVSEANSATSNALQQTENSLARSGLTRTPYGQSVLSSARMQGNQTAAQIPTTYAQNFISQAPAYSQNLLTTILGSLRKTTSRSGPYGT